MFTQKVELENPIIRDWPRQSWHYITPTINRCGCDNVAKYLVDGDPHCNVCMLDAIDTEVYVRVRKI